MSAPTLPTLSDALIAAMERVAGTLDELSPDQLRDLAAGRGRLVYTPCAVPPRPRTRPAPAGDLAADVAAIRAMATPADVRTHLGQRRFTVAVLRDLARALGPTVPASGRNRAELMHGIVEGTVGFRARSAALSDNAWAY